MPPRSPALDTFLSRLGCQLGERLRTDEEARRAASGDESGLPAALPAAVVFPEQADEVAVVCREATALGVGLVPRGGGTGKAGGCIPTAEQLVVDFSCMSRVVALRPEDQYAVVEPGVITGDLHAAVADVGFLYPPDPGSFESCTIGGNIATNAGGARAAKYGVTQKYVWGVEVVLPCGERLRLGRRSIKGVAGYNTTDLIVGSEGTLGFVTEATVHIIPAPPAVHTAWLSFVDLLAASGAAEAIFAAGVLPRTLEVMDQTSLDLVRPVAPFAVPRAGAALLLETDGDDAPAFAALTRACEIAYERGATDSAVAMSDKDREAMRRTRRLVSSSTKDAFPFKISDDIAVPRSQMIPLIERARDDAEAAGLRLSTYGHMGDGNLHLNLLCAEGEQPAAESFRRRVLAFAVGIGGTVSGEHGIGLAKRDVLPIEHGEGLLTLQRKIKAVFDPTGIMNPGKVFSL